MAIQVEMFFFSRPIRAVEASSAVETLVAGAVEDGDVAADVAEGGVAFHAAELGP